MGACCRAHPGRSENSTFCLEGLTSAAHHCSGRHENYCLCGSVSMADWFEDAGIRCGFVHHDIEWVGLFHCCSIVSCGRLFVCIGFPLACCADAGISFVFLHMPVSGLESVSCM